MSVTITCPNCGARPVEEYRFGGEAILRSPGEETQDGLVDRTWMLTNAEGAARERWFHEAGCRRWLTMTRDTRIDGESMT